MFFSRKVGNIVKILVNKKILFVRFTAFLVQQIELYIYPQTLWCYFMVRQVLRVNFLKEEGNRELLSNTSFGEGNLNFAKFNVEHEFLTNVTIGQLLRGNSQEKKVSVSYPDRTDSAMRRWSNVFF